MSKKINPKLLALHRQWLRADAVKYVLFIKDETKVPLSDELKDLGLFYSSILRLEVFYALLYVVIEGYKQLDVNCE